MAISRVGTASGNLNITIPTHQVGDLIVLFQFQDSGFAFSPPGLPSGFTAASTAGNYGRLSYRIATATTLTVSNMSGTNASIAMVYRGVTLGNVAGATATGNLSFPAVTNGDSGTSWMGAVVGHRSTNVTIEVAPTGMTNQVAYNNGSTEAAGH